MESADLIGTRLKQVQDLLDGGLAELYSDLGLPGFRPRYTPVLKVLEAQDGQPIRDLATAVGVSHSAMSQTVVDFYKIQVPAQPKTTYAASVTGGRW